MKNNIFPKHYHSILNLVDTELAIKFVKDHFEENLSEALKLTRVSAPLFVDPDTGLNDNLNGVEKAVSFKANESGERLEIVQSLAKWKRFALKKYDIDGLYTDMNAIRPFEETDNMHSLYVDQWDWEKRLSPENRNADYLKQTVNEIYNAFLKTYAQLVSHYPALASSFPNEIKFVTTEEAEALYPKLDRKEREKALSKKYGAIFLMKIGANLKDGKPHDGRAADYDDWSLNGDIIVYYDVLDIAFELSSMGIRVNKESLLSQLKERGEEAKLKLPYHQSIIEGSLPLSIGGGIGQSRLCMLLLRKAHIGEVQSSTWEEKDVQAFKEAGIELL